MHACDQGAGGPVSTAGGQHLPIANLIAFALAGFLVIMTENLPAGLLPQMASDLAVSEALAGQTVTAFALGCVTAAIPIIVATQHWNRRMLFLMAIAGLLVFNSLTALSHSYPLTLATRFAAGMSAGIVHALLAVYARRLAPDRLKGRSVAIVGVGQPIALCCGVPLGTWLGSIVDWRMAFWAMSLLASAIAVWVRLGVPDLPGPGRAAAVPARKVMTTAGVVPVLMVLFAWIFAHNILYTYIAPYLAATSTGVRLETILAVFGAAAVFGIIWTGIVIDRRLRSATLASICLFGFAATILALPHSSSLLTVLAVALWGMTFGGAPTLLQTALADAAGPQAEVAQSILVTVFNLAVAAGGLFGGILVGTMGTTALPVAVMPLIGGALLVTLRSKQSGFPPAQRTMS